MEFNDFFWELDREKLDQKQFARALSDFQIFARYLRQLLTLTTPAHSHGKMT